MVRSLRNAGVVAALLLLLMGAGAAQAGTISLEWDAAQNAQGYRVYYGTASGQYSRVQDVGNALTADLGGLDDCTDYYVAVKAYNTAGESALFSNEISGMARPLISQAGPSSMQGSQFTMTIDGANYATGATVETDNPNVFLQNPRVVSCRQMQVSVRIEPMTQNVRAAQVGTFRVTVTNPDRVFGQQSNAFEVLVNPRRFDVNRADDATLDRLDGKDTVFLARTFGTREGEATWDPDGDFNGDGWVDGEDLAYLAANFGWCWNGTTWASAACGQR